MRRAIVLVIATLAAAVVPQAASAALPPIHHVYIIVLENENASTTFGASSPAPYLSQTLRSQGAFVPRYYGIGHNSLDNYIAMISGQAPNPTTQSDCQFYSDFVAASSAPYGQVGGLGCIYPAGTPTIASQLQAAGLTWRDYNDGMGADPTREASVCGHPPVGARDNTQVATAADQYATRHNPFVYFHSIIDDTALCNTRVVRLDQLPQDLAAPAAPSYSFITPNLCNDGHDATCADGGAGGLARADQFLRQWVPQILGSTAFKRDGGLLILTFDEATASDASSCCNEIPGPSSAQPGGGGPGGGNTGAVLLSPYIRSGTVTQQAYNHYTMLRSIEDLFGLGHIGYAQLPGESSFGSDVFACAPARPPVAVRGRLPAGSEFNNAHVVGRGRTRTLALGSVGAASLTVTVTAPHHRRTVLRRTLAPCGTYTLRLPAALGGRRRWMVRVSASPLSGGTQTAQLRY